MPNKKTSTLTLGTPRQKLTIGSRKVVAKKT